MTLKYGIMLNGKLTFVYIYLRATCNESNSSKAIDLFSSLLPFYLKSNYSQSDKF